MTTISVDAMSTKKVVHMPKIILLIRILCSKNSSSLFKATTSIISRVMSKKIANFSQSCEILERSVALYAALGM